MRHLARAIGLATTVLGTVGPLRAGAQQSTPAPASAPRCAYEVAQGVSCPLYDVSMVQLLATPERYNGQRVRVIGFVHLEFEGDAVYLHREDFEASLTNNALWISFRPGVPAPQASRSDPISDNYVLLEGTFDATDHGHMGLFGGTIKDISRADPWRPARRPTGFRRP